MQKLPTRTKKLLDTKEKVCAAAVYYLNRRFYTCFELKTKLRKRGAEARHIEGALAELAERGWLDEEKLAEAHIHHRSANCLRGPFCVRQELLNRGLNHELTESSLARWYDRDAEREVIDLFLDKELRHAPFDLTDKKALDKLRRKLANRGFSLFLINERLQFLKNVDKC